MHYFLRNADARAARQLIFIGEQNDVRSQLDAAEREAYEELFAKYDGKSIADDTHEFLDNYRNLIRLIGRTLEMSTTTLLIDLKRRRALNQDKLNYELNIGARRFKCTTVPIVRNDYGVVGAVCINISLRRTSSAATSTSRRSAASANCATRRASVRAGGACSATGSRRRRWCRPAPAR